MRRFPVGTILLPFDPMAPAAAARAARAAGFAHIDVHTSVDPASLCLPVGCFLAHPEAPAWPAEASAPVMATPFDAAAPDAWARTVARFAAAPGCLMEPTTLSVVNSTEAVRAMLADVPGLRLALDVAHVAAWGGDPLELLDFADHVQLRQAAPGRRQLHVDDPAGVVDFAAVLRRLEALGYRGALTVEYFDLPDRGLGLDDPMGWAVDLLRHVRGLQ